MLAECRTCGLEFDAPINTIVFPPQCRHCKGDGEASEQARQRALHAAEAEVIAAARRLYEVAGDRGATLYAALDQVMPLLEAVAALDRLAEARGGRG